jgi:hypothetical protein
MYAAWSGCGVGLLVVLQARGTDGTRASADVRAADRATADRRVQVRARRAGAAARRGVEWGSGRATKDGARGRSVEWADFESARMGIGSRSRQPVPAGARWRGMPQPGPARQPAVCGENHRRQGGRCMFDRGWLRAS